MDEFRNGEMDEFMGNESCYKWMLFQRLLYY